MERDYKQRMLRITVAEGSLTLDEKGRMPGRGAYLHRDEACISGFVRNKSRESRSLRRVISPDDRRKLAELIHTRLDRNAALE
jgi:predicted RNA-binding protein YlxR (DUF448 family)